MALNPPDRTFLNFAESFILSFWLLFRVFLQGFPIATVSIFVTVPHQSEAPVRGRTGFSKIGGLLPSFPSVSCPNFRIASLQKIVLELFFRTGTLATQATKIWNKKWGSLYSCRTEKITIPWRIKLGANKNQPFYQCARATAHVRGVFK